MGRPSSGDRVQVNVRLLRTLRERIDTARGPMSRDAWIAMAAEKALDPVAAYHDPQLRSSVHRHTAGVPLRTEFSGGQKIRVYRCADQACGMEMTQ